MPAQPFYGSSNNIGPSAAVPSVSSSSGHATSAPETLILSHASIANPEIKAIAQVMRGTQIIDTTTSTIGQVQSMPFVPALTPDSTKTFNVKAQVRISQSELVSTDFSLEVIARDTRNIPLAKKVKTINHQKQVKRYMTVTIPPKLTTSPSPDGATYIEITQQDPVATSVDLYYRIFSITGGTAYKHITEIRINKLSGPQVSVLNVPNSGTLLVRAVATCQGKSSGLFTDIVVRPFTSKNQKSAEDMNHGVLQSYSNSTGIFIKSTTIIGNSNFACIARKNISDSDKKFTNITEYKPIKGGAPGLSHQDDSVQLGTTYEYKLRFLMPDGTELLSKHSSVNKKVQMFPTPSIIISRFVTTPANTAGKFGVRFNIYTDNKSSTAESVIFSSLKKMGLSKKYLDEFKESKDMSSKIYFFHVIRKNLVTGQESDFGYVRPGTFSDTGTKAPSPQQSFAYEYCIELMCRDPDQIIEELKNTKAFRQHKLFDQSPVTGKASVAEKANVNVNTQSKYFSPHAIIQSTISTGDALVKNHSGGSLGMSGTGNIKILPVSLPASSDIIIKNPLVSSNEFGDVFLEWKTAGTAGVDHFIITAKRQGFTYPCGVCHHKKSGNKYLFVDRTQKTVPGVITYTITPVLLDFNRAEATIAGQVAVVGD